MCFKPWQYFGYTRDDFERLESSKRLKLLVNECLDYRFFLDHLFVDKEQGKLLFFSDSSKKTVASYGLCTIFDYWSFLGEKSYFNFYAFLFDQYFALLAQLVQNAYLNMDSRELYFGFLRQARCAYDFLRRTFTVLRSSKYEVRYDRQLRRYKSVLSLLAIEKRAYDKQYCI